jgi:hypothetical protein
MGRHDGEVPSRSEGRQWAEFGGSRHDLGPRCQAAWKLAGAGSCGVRPSRRVSAPPAAARPPTRQGGMRLNPSMEWTRDESTKQTHAGGLFTSMPSADRFRLAGRCGGNPRWCIGNPGRGVGNPGRCLGLCCWALSGRELERVRAAAPGRATFNSLTEGGA